MSYERWFKEKEFDLVLYRVRQWLAEEPTVKSQNFIISPIFDADTDEVLVWQAVLYYVKVAENG